MRIRTDGDYAYRRDAIECAADFYYCNKTKAVVSACDDVPKFVQAARQVLERDDLTLGQRQPLTDICRYSGFEIDTGPASIPSNNSSIKYYNDFIISHRNCLVEGV